MFLKISKENNPCQKVQLHWKMLFIWWCEHIQNRREWLMIAKTKIISRQWVFLSGGRIQNLITFKLCRQKVLDAVNEKELLFKVGANTILLPKQRHIWPKKSFREWPKIPKYRFLWENGKMGGIWQHSCSTVPKTPVVSTTLTLSEVTWCCVRE